MASSAAGVATERRDHRDVVEQHQPEPRVLGIARLAGQVVVAQHVDVLDVRFPTDLLEHRAGEHLGPEDRRHALRFDLLDQLGDLARRRILEVRHLDRSDHVPVVLLGEVGVGVVVGEQLADRHGGERLAHRRVELVDQGGEGVVVGGVVVGVVGVAGRHVVADDLGVAQRHRRVGPQVRIGLAAVLGEREVVDVLVLGDRLLAELDDLGVVGEVGLGELAASAPRVADR